MIGVARLLAASAIAMMLPSAAQSQIQTVAPDYQPKDQDERGLWMQAEEYERRLVNSNFVIRDPALNAYVRDVFCRTVGEAQCKPIRIYVMRTPYFNANMAPNGVMQVWSGLFLRVRDEAQLAAVLGHEYVHYANQHSLKMFREVKSKTGAMAFLGFVPFGFIAQIGVAGSLFSYSRDMESEADAGSVVLLGGAGYAPVSASKIWEQLRLEMDATALARGTKSRKDKNGGMFGTHPPSAERMTALAALAAAQPVSGEAKTNRDAYRAALGGWWASFVDDQVKLNDFGGTELLLAELARDGWTPELRFARGELYRARGTPADLVKAAEFYREAVADPAAPVEAWRGLGLALLRAGAHDEGRASLREYLSRKPDAPDHAMIAAMAKGGN